MATESLSSSPHTYHCVCAQLLIASTTPLSALPRRRIDKATILPLTSQPTQLIPGNEDHIAQLREPLTEYIFDPSLALAERQSAGSSGTTVAATMKMLKKEVVLSMEDGYEKRYLLRCTRCEIVWGYMLRWEQWADNQGQEGRREDVVYVLDGAVAESQNLLAGKIGG